MRLFQIFLPSVASTVVLAETEVVEVVELVVPDDDDDVFGVFGVFFGAVVAVGAVVPVVDVVVASSSSSSPNPNFDLRSSSHPWLHAIVRTMARTDRHMQHDATDTSIMVEESLALMNGHEKKVTCPLQNCTTTVPPH